MTLIDIAVLDLIESLRLRLFSLDPRGLRALAELPSGWWILPALLLGLAGWGALGWLAVRMVRGWL
ncbi:hypothetical protein [Frigidibacter sp. MR17.24]|uniref:hypothetical protein n=1 Tax=Frigidibacter sp. MR17.24 TaxID=3127345 RepID=UPI003012B1D8